MKIQERECSNQGESLGMGYDSLKNIHLPNCAINLSSIKLEEILSAQQIPVEEKCRFEHIENESCLTSSFSLSAKIGAEVGGIASGYGIPCLFSANAKADFFSGVKMKEESLYILLDYQLKNATYRIPSPALSDEAERIIRDQSNPGKFRKKYGDEFIIGFKTGVDFTAVIEVMNIDKSIRERTFLEIRTEISDLLADLMSLPIKEVGGNVENEHAKALKQYSSKTLCLKRPPNIHEDGISLTLDRLILDFLQFKKEIANSREKHLKYTALFADYEQLIEVQHDIMTPEQKRLKVRLNRLRGIKLQKQTLMLDMQNHLRFQGATTEMPGTMERLTKLSDDVDELDEFIGECLYLPESMTDEKYRLFLDSDFRYRYLK
jgi:hypothetical protein